MKIANSVHVRVFAYEGDDEQKIVETLRKLFPFDLEKEKIEIKRQAATGFEEKKIKIFEVELNKDRHTSHFIESLVSSLGEEQRELLIRQEESRLDKEFNFFIRLDKEKMIKENKFWITESGNCYHVKINIACFPRKREACLEAIRNIFKVG